MKVNINDKDYTLKYGFKAMMIYESITKTTFAPKNISDMIYFFYSCLLAGNKDENIDWDIFIGWIDEHPEAFEEFATWLANINERNDVLNPDYKDAADEEDSKKKTP